MKSIDGKEKKTPKKASRKSPRYIIGIDEVGRGPIAGPVAVGAFLLHARAGALFRGVRESKQLTEDQREEWFEKIEAAVAAVPEESAVEVGRSHPLVDFRVTMVSEKVIDKKGISFAIRTALEKSLSALIADHSIDPSECLVLLDGGLRAPAAFVHQKTIIKGDVKEKSIALASICAKVTRDRHMHKQAKKYPRYGFDVHKGYGTRRHYGAIKMHGLSAIHRRSFLRGLNADTLAKNPHML